MGTYLEAAGLSWASPNHPIQGPSGLLLSRLASLGLSWLRHRRHHLEGQGQGSGFLLPEGEANMEAAAEAVRSVAGGGGRGVTSNTNESLLGLAVLSDSA